MRLPQSILRSLSVRTVHFLTIGIAILLFGLVPRAVAKPSQLVFTTSNLKFGSVVVGQTATFPVTVTNNGQTSVTISGMAVSNSAFTSASLSLPLVLLAGESFALNVSFAPAVAGWTGGTIKFSTDGSNAAALQVEGTGVSSEAVTANPSTVSFGQVAIGTTSTIPVVLTNLRHWKVNLQALGTTGSGFSTSGPTFPLTLGAGQSVTVIVTFAPQSVGATGGSLFVSGPRLAILLTGSGSAPGQLISNPSSLNFANVQVGSGQTLMDSLTNTGGASVTISQVTASGAGFSISGLNVPLTLNPGASVTFSAAFAPQSAANASGSITISSDALNPTLTVSLSGTGSAQGQLTLTPTALNFGNTSVGTTVSQTSSLSAGGASVTISSASMSGAEFSLSGISLPVTIAAGQSVPITLTFAPQASGNASAILSFASNASNVPSETLTGVGGAPPQHSSSLSWTDAGSGIVGYNVYRGSVSGGPYTKINTGLDTTVAYSDDSVLAGQTYYYVATAIDGSGSESGYSNEAQVVIPTP